MTELIREWKYTTTRVRWAIYRSDEPTHLVRIDGQWIQQQIDEVRRKPKRYRIYLDWPGAFMFNDPDIGDADTIISYIQEP